MSLRPSPCRLALLAVIALSALLSTSLPAAGYPPHVIALKGHADHGGYDVEFTYDTVRHTVNGFAVDFTCRGRKAVYDQDLHTIVDGGDDDVALWAVKAGGRVKGTRPGELSRFSEDGDFDLGAGSLSLDATVRTSGRTVLISGFAEAHDGKRCPSAYLRFRAAGRRPAS